MSSRSKKIVELALQMEEHTDDESDSDPFSAVDSDLDPMFLPSSNDELSDSSDISLTEIIGQKKKFTKTTGERPEQVYNFENQPCCSKSLPVAEFQEAGVQNEDGTQNLNVSSTETGDNLENVLDEEEAADQNEHTWREPVGNHQVFDYSAESGLHAGYAAVLINNLSPYSCFRYFVDDEIINEMVNQTNLYATQVLFEAEDVSRESRLHRWVPTDKGEMLKFIGIVAYMGMVRMPSLEKYWSTDELFQISIIPKVMSRNRFQLLLRMWHFSDNNDCPEGDRLHKIKPLLDALVKKFQEIYTPGRTFCIDESVVPFQGRLLFKQYIPNKTHKYGVKLFKLCSDNGYTWNIRIYAGKEKQERDASVGTNIVLKLSQDLLDTGRTIAADNYYTSLELANILLDHKTHYIGTLRANQRGNPKEVILKNLKKGEIFGLENGRGVCVLKWKDKRDVLLLSTKHTTETVDVQRRTGIVKKPRAVMEYNEAKSSIDQSDQMARYHSPVRKSLKWYRKLAIEFLLGTALVNAHIVYNLLANKKLKIPEFREEVIRSLFTDHGDAGELDVRQEKITKKTAKIHTLCRKEGQFDKVRKYCKGCYAKKLRGEITKNCVKKVVTFCGVCDDQPHFCLNCFNTTHAK
ncbi:unnamed protein product [Acanthoscelides obtectus]|uniref:PiggyBac transposable element-derived protein domain-containing protein n=1 Tax=Acanthoscelides obtectus TaxID=200917 RepID=A0A9P0KHH0_ACAOB|nr:unnamed protein product [Acanthoscelides obtectus]CAK1662894.1 PiggyBac transposable element-derived protein 4 [Acanthoscelides obtectus]